MKITKVSTNGNLDRLAIKLFKVFSKTEYALKASGYHCGDGKAKANWPKFSIAVESLIANPSSSELKEAITFILNHPPMKQMIVDGKIQWVAVAPSTNSQADTLLQYVCRVRNNLFHGGKFNRHWLDPDRSEPLLRYSLQILVDSVAFVPEVKEAYYG